MKRQIMHVYCMKNVKMNNNNSSENLKNILGLYNYYIQTINNFPYSIWRFIDGNATRRDYIAIDNANICATLSSLDLSGNDHLNPSRCHKQESTFGLVFLEQIIPL